MAIGHLWPGRVGKEGLEAVAPQASPDLSDDLLGGVGVHDRSAIVPIEAEGGR